MKQAYTLWPIQRLARKAKRITTNEVLTLAAVLVAFIIATLIAWLILEVYYAI